MKSPVTEITVAIFAVVVITAIGIHLKGKSNLAPLEIELPRAVFVGTEKPIRVDNLKKFSTEDRPPFLAPAGTDMHYVETHKGELIDAKGTKARYVRLYRNGNNNNDLNHYIEVEVYGKPVK
ncbi:MAG: hypothetical protein A2Z25_10600 [Planctomycetes bacterium RBG_16_55_9]|nr:MAG: hypothetical protein A2Z25_10600 [Planctomycetes bacterium RBG_16_55_9]